MSSTQHSATRTVSAHADTSPHSVHTNSCDLRSACIRPARAGPPARDAIGHAQRRTYTLGTAPTLGAVGFEKTPPTTGNVAHKRCEAGSEGLLTEGPVGKPRGGNRSNKLAAPSRKRIFESRAPSVLRPDFIEPEPSNAHELTFIWMDTGISIQCVPPLHHPAPWTTSI